MFKAKSKLDVVWFIFLSCAFLALLILCVEAWRRGLDAQGIAGLFAYGLIYLFYIGLFFALVLIGADYIVNLVARRKKVSEIDSDVRSYHKIFLAFLILELAIGAFIWLHPLGYVASISIGFIAFIIASLILSHRMRRFRENPDVERKIVELHDKILKSTDDPNEPARWVP